MTTPNIDTFEHDIANEIIHKEASMGDIASAAGEIGNTSAEKSWPLIIGASVLFLCGLIAVLLGGYLYYTKNHAPAPLSLTPSDGLQANQNQGIPLVTLSQTLDDGIGRFITYVTPSPYGYSMTVTTYSPVFAFMITKEADYADELAKAVGSPRDTSTSTPPFTFTDVTINNQNMRVGTSASSTVVYAFANTQLLLIASSTDGILTLRSAILH
ncbi:MAG: hypothetical protein WC444_03070 [Candidatus Paceibacterota bacterium]